MIKTGKTRPYCMYHHIRKGGFFMDKSRRLKIWELSALVTLCVCLLTGLWAEGRQQRLAAGLVRLHVLAVSDEAEEQAVKLRVRDAVLRYLAPYLDGVKSADEAEAILSGKLDGVRAAAEQAAEGRTVRVTLGDERYPTRDYAGFSLPAGRYRSLRVVLGEGKGHNWWCVVFPPVCLAAVEREAVRPVMNPEDYALITREDGWQIRFRIVELWGELFSVPACGD
jgi:stage II sporulation protein R